MIKAVLLVIDMLNDFFKEGPLADRRADLASSINGLAALFRERNLPIIWIRQEFAPDLSDAFLVLRERGTPITIADTEGCRILPELDVAPTDRVIVKKRYSAFFGTDLDDILASLSPEHIVLCGVNTHACVRTTAIDAYQRDYSVIVASECVASYDEEHHRVTMRYLEDRIARSISNSEIAELLAPHERASGNDDDEGRRSKGN